MCKGKTERNCDFFCWKHRPIVRKLPDFDNRFNHQTISFQNSEILLLLCYLTSRQTWLNPLVDDSKYGKIAKLKIIINKIFNKQHQLGVWKKHTNLGLPPLNFQLPVADTITHSRFRFSTDYLSKKQVYWNRPIFESYSIVLQFKIFFHKTGTDNSLILK
jgi:hypothetical protein